MEQKDFEKINMIISRIIKLKYDMVNNKLDEESNLLMKKLIKFYDNCDSSDSSNEKVEDEEDEEDEEKEENEEDEEDEEDETSENSNDLSDIETQYEISDVDEKESNNINKIFAKYMIELRKNKKFLYNSFN
jgi:hypothetical protein